MTRSSVPLDEHKLVRLHALQILPLVVGVVLDTQSLSIAIGVPKSSRFEIVLDINAAVVAECERPVPGGMVNRPPQIDDLETLGKQAVGVFSRQVSMYTCGSSRMRPVNMHTLNRWTLFESVICLHCIVAADSCGG